MKKNVTNVSADAMTALMNYGWPGNVRELENAVERAFILSGDEISPNDLPQRVRRSIGTGDWNNDGRPSLEEIERRYVLETLESTDHDKVAAAKILGIDLSTLYRKMKRYEELWAIERELRRRSNPSLRHAI